MKNKSHQKAVTTKVHATFNKFRSLADVPVLKKKSEGATAVEFERPGNEQQYVAALYELFFLAPDKELAGRIGSRLEATE